MLEYPTKYKFFPKTLDLVAIIIGIALLIFIAKKDEKSYVNEITGIEMFIVKLNYPKLQNKNGHYCKSKLDKVAKVVYRLSGTV